jgi:hypothetical protein
MKKRDRDIEKEYTFKQMAAKLRRLADCLENIEHEREGKAEEVEFQFKWQRSQ